MAVFSSEIEAELQAAMGMEDITGRLRALVNESQVENGTLSATITGSTGSLTAIEYEPGVMQDLRRAIDRMAPQELEYEHEKAWHDGNGHSHVQAAIIGPSISMQIRDGKMVSGTWQQVVAINHDTRSRRRKIAVTITGERTNQT
ncbi:MAG: secondary thiamine-phosphate synthase enzyme YjbQ [Thermodesulfobacteriota bacterium]